MKTLDLPGTSASRTVDVSGREGGLAGAQLAKWLGNRLWLKGYNTFGI